MQWTFALRHSDASLSHLECFACSDGCAFISFMLSLSTRAPSSLQQQPSGVHCRALFEGSKSRFGKFPQSPSPRLVHLWAAHMHQRLHTLVRRHSWFPSEVVVSAVRVWENVNPDKIGPQSFSTWEQCRVPPCPSCNSDFSMFPKGLAFHRHEWEVGSQWVMALLHLGDGRKYFCSRGWHYRWPPWGKGQMHRPTNSTTSVLAAEEPERGIRVVVKDQNSQTVFPAFKGLCEGD